MTTDVKFPLFLKKTAITLLGVISLFTYTSITQAQPAACVDETAQAVFLPVSATVCLQKIKITDSSGTKYYQAALKWVGAEKPQKFQLISVEADSEADEGSPFFSPETGILTLPQVDIPDTYGTERYTAELVLKQENGTSLFELTSTVAYIPPGYVEAQDWKPYVLLETNERQAISLLGQSLPYAQLANASYSFDNPEFGIWEVIEQESKDSGMQAVVYKNQQTDELVLAFRGTEICNFPCSLKETQESILDLAADALLSIGESGPQFRHAFNFAEEIRNRYQNHEITVTGHSLGGALAQAVGATLGLQTFAFNSAPVPDDYFDKHPTDLSAETLSNIIHVISDIYDPVSYANDSGESYLNAVHVSPLVQFDFTQKKVIPDLGVDHLEKLYELRFDKHSMSKLIENMSDLSTLYRQGW